MANINQFNFKELQDSEIMMTQECYIRLMSILNVTGFQIGEHKCFLYGKEIAPNKILLTDTNKFDDYITTGKGSKNPSDHGVYMESSSNIAKELLTKLKANEENFIVCDIHTHPSGISDGDDYRYFSGTDLQSAIDFSTALKKLAPNVKFINGLISVDNNKGNSVISFVWCDNGSQFYKLRNVSIVEKQGDQYIKVSSLKNMDGVEYLETNFNVEECSV